MYRPKESAAVEGDNPTQRATDVGMKKYCVAIFAVNSAIQPQIAASQLPMPTCVVLNLGYTHV